MNKLFLLSFMLIVSGMLHSQTRISGQIIDQSTNQPLAFAQIRGLNSQLGTLSNEEGYFSLNLGRNEQDTFAVSHIGYEYFAIPVSEISNRSNFNVLLKARVVELDEVVIVPKEPEELLKEALANIEDNYSHDPMNMQGFYRELVSQNDTFVEFNEAIVDIYKVPNGLEKAKGNQVKLIKGRTLSEGERFENIDIDMGSDGPNESISQPVIGEPVAAHFLDVKQFKNYEYSLDGVTTYNDRDVYIISFDQKRKLRHRLYQGKIYLDVKTMAFVSIDFKLSDKGKKFRLGRVIGMGGRMAMTVIRAMGFDILYQQETGRQDFVYHRGQWYLNYSRHDVQCTIKLPKKIAKNEEIGYMEIPEGWKGKEYIAYTVLREIAITKMEPNRADKFPASETLQKDSTLPDQIGDYDEEFWENYNYLKSTDSLRKIADEMKREN